MGEISKEKSEAPSQWRVLKFVQLFIGDEEERKNMQNPVFVWDYSSCKDHSDVLKDWLGKKGLNFKLAEDELPKTHGKEYAAGGMGIAILNSDNELVVDKPAESLEYRLKPSKKHLEQVCEYFPSEIKSVEFK